MKPLLYALVVASTCCTLLAQLLLKQVISTGHVRSALQEGILHFVLAVATVPLAWLALGIQATGFMLWLLVLSKEKMAIAFALSGSFFYLLVSFAGIFFFSERLTGYQWGGIVLISTGVLLVAARS